PAGFHTIAARYSGDDSHLPSDSDPVAQRMSYGTYSARDLTPGINHSSTATVVNEAAKTAGLVSLLDAQGRLVATVAFNGLPEAYTLYGGRWIFPTAIDASGSVSGRFAARPGD